MTSSNSVRLIFFEQSIGCDACADVHRALEHIAREHKHVTLVVLNLALDSDKAAEYGVDRAPAIIVEAAAPGRIRYYGAPLGNELPTLMEAITMTATGETALTDPSRARLKTLSTPVHLQVFFTPSCVYCPRMISLANQLAVASPLVSTTAIDATEYPDLVGRYNVNGVPKTVINERVEILGAVPEHELVAAIIRR